MSETDVDKYIATFPAETQEILQAVRAAIRRAVPDADEVISYRMQRSSSMASLSTSLLGKITLDCIRRLWVTSLWRKLLLRTLGQKEISSCQLTSPCQSL